jgi:hypothetical protein
MIPPGFMAGVEKRCRFFRKMKKNFAKYKTGPGSKKGSSLFRRINNWLHLWLGLVSGLIVFVVCITGCLWVFNEEIIYWFEPKIRSEILEQPVVKPSSILEICKKEFPGSNVSYAYHQQGTAIRVALENPVDQSTYILFVSPYSGHIQGRKRYAPGEADFFDVMLEGHRYLWLPHEIGRPLVNYGTYYSLPESSGGIPASGRTVRLIRVLKSDGTPAGNGLTSTFTTYWDFTASWSYWYWL